MRELQSHVVKGTDTKKGGKLGIFYHLPASLGEDLGLSFGPWKPTGTA